MKEIQSFVEQYNLIHDGDGIVIAFSGGPDSVYLALSLLSLKEEYHLRLAAVHINHNLQEIAGAHADFAKAFCQEHGIDYYEFSGDIKGLASEQKMTIEEAGRAYRYEKFYEVLHLLSYDSIAVAHHMDDQAETVLFRMARGTGWQGMAGMRPKQGDIIRPLLGMSKDEIVCELEQIGQSYNVDPTNAHTDYARNRIRHNVMPELEQINQKAAQHIASLAGQMAELGEYLRPQIEMLYEEAVTKKDERYELDMAKLSGCPSFLRMELLHLVLKKVCKTEKDITRKHLEQLDRLCHMQSGKEISLPYGKKAIRQYERIIFTDQISEESAEYAPITFAGEGDYYIDSWQAVLHARILQKMTGICEKKYTKYFSYDKIKKELCVRTARDQDYFVMNKAGQKKRLNRYFIDCKIPKEERSRIPLITEGSHVLWVVGGRISEACKVTDDTEYILELTWERRR